MWPPRPWQKSIQTPTVNGFSSTFFQRQSDAVIRIVARLFTIIPTRADYRNRFSMQSETQVSKNVLVVTPFAIWQHTKFCHKPGVFIAVDSMLPCRSFAMSTRHTTQSCKDFVVSWSFSLHKHQTMPANSQ